MQKLNINSQKRYKHLFLFLQGPLQSRDSVVSCIDMPIGMAIGIGIGMHDWYDDRMA